MADIAGLEPVSCGFKSRSPYPNKPSDSSTDRMLGYEPGDVGSIPPLTTIFNLLLIPMPTCHRASMPLAAPPRVPSRLRRALANRPTGQLIN